MISVVFNKKTTVLQYDCKPDPAYNTSKQIMANMTIHSIAVVNIFTQCIRNRKYRTSHYPDTQEPKQLDGCVHHIENMLPINVLNSIICGISVILENGLFLL